MKILSKKFSQTFTSSGRRSNMKFNVTLNSAENDWEESWKLKDGWMDDGKLLLRQALECAMTCILPMMLMQNNSIYWNGLEKNREHFVMKLWSDIWSLHGFGSTAQTETDPIVTIENHQSQLFEKAFQIYRISSF